ncbi:hypothetical protein GCM10027034_24740 [Ramlibacter solisilvae]|uniref:Uncharacterized protein n=1 Tax=Ramlibacter tataouinensis TaxID=94132 RepID=A0A127JQ99_9BURK|nr:hypothetical protein [Ramlibacter tataouinensis]AMO22171.1 hypothetical protein UC35_03795 [Ramlibacter tataouinensis]
MTSVDPANQLAALIRVQVASLRQRQASRTTAGGRQPTSLPVDGAGQGADLASIVAQRIKAISEDDPQRERKAFRLFLETVLLSELGPEIVNDPSFAVMVDHVQQQMESDPDLAQASLEAARVLLKSAESR